MAAIDLLLPEKAAEAPTFFYATVTQALPPLIRLDGDTDPIPDSPTVLAAVAVGDRVFVMRKAKKLIVLGALNGGTPVELSTANLDTILSAGAYTQSQNAEATLATNYPEVVAGLLEVSRNTAGGMVWQRYTTYAASDTRGFHVWERGYYNSNWTPWELIGTPIGAISAWGTATAPTGWLLCNGAAVSRTTYSSLYALIGTTYGTGDGSTTFNVPNLKGKVIVGLDSAQTEFDAINESGGAKTHTLGTTEIPAHTHGAATLTGSISNFAVQSSGTGASASGIASVNTTPGTVGYPSSSGSGNSGWSDEIDLNATHTHTSVGGGAAHNNLQPYLTLNYIIRA